ncbi:MAG: 4-hydroxy-3-methylbut-2-enyl diphosphate reductase [Sphaerochaetaceae bacterium]|nr:4-hydroxy-3-methylbut-2-enyl diphosphate reductase [Sphaerochaetaceae bacterium]
MKIVISKRIGYCKGVARAVYYAHKTLQLANERGLKAYCIGSLAHNERVRSDFENEGLKFISSPDGHDPGIALISAHGIPIALRQRFIDMGFELVDGTCNNIIINQKSILKYAEMGYCIVVVGIPNHSETLCLQGTELFSGVPVASVLVSSVSDVDLIPEGFPLFVIAQTTFKQDLFREIVAEIKKRFDDVIVRNSLCTSPLARQRQILDLCDSCDAVIVVGGAQSANTAAIADISASRGIRTIRIEKPSEIPEFIYQAECVGIASGSSTPKEEIEDIVKELNNHV